MRSTFNFQGLEDRRLEKVVSDRDDFERLVLRLGETRQQSLEEGDFCFRVVFVSEQNYCVTRLEEQYLMWRKDFLTKEIPR
jgi:hypothetical protein